MLSSKRLALVLICLLAACTPAAPETPATLPPPVIPTYPMGAPVAATPLPAASATPAAPVATATPQPSPTPAALRFAVIGDYGSGDQNAADVAALVKSWNPDFILTVGDNNYPIGAPEVMDDRVGKFYADYISPYHGAYGAGASTNRFWPTLGNHDYDTNNAQAYFDYFSLPNNERYYTFTAGPVDFFALNADSREPDGVSQVSTQAQWLQTALAQSTSPWQIAYFHQCPYSSGYQGPVTWMQWPFEAWGVDAVLSGHDHIYERLAIGGIPYIVNGLGGGEIYYFPGVLPESQARFDADYGALRVTATSTQMTFEFITRAGQLVDTWTVNK